MALDFPASPITGATYTGPNGVIWVFDGAKWANGTTIGTAYAPIQSPVFTGNPTAPTPPVADNDTSLATTQFVQSTVAPAFNGVGRNLIHNPLFNIAQRGAGVFGTLGTFTLDRWFMTGVSDTVNVSQQPAVDGSRTQVGDEALAYFLSAAIGGNAAAGAYSYLAQSIEDVRRLAGKTVTVSFWATSASGLKLGINILQSFGTGGSPSATAWVLPTGVAVTLTGGFVRYSATIAIPSSIGKTLGTNSNHFTQLAFWLSSGASTNALAGNIGVQNGTISIWGVQLEVGSVATPLEKPDPRYDLSNCSRFYQSGGWAAASSRADGAGQAAFTGTTLATTMRATPTIAFYNTTASNGTGTVATQISSSAFVFQTNAIAAALFYTMTQYTASADL